MERTRRSALGSLLSNCKWSAETKITASSLTGCKSLGRGRTTYEEFARHLVHCFVRCGPTIPDFLLNATKNNPPHRNWAPAAGLGQSSNPHPLFLFRAPQLIMIILISTGQPMNFSYLSWSQLLQRWGSGFFPDSWSCFSCCKMQGFQVPRDQEEMKDERHKGARF